MPSSMCSKSSPRRTKLRWRRRRSLGCSRSPGVSSPIIGARRLTQLEDNLRALDVTLTAEEIAQLNTLTRPVLGFPQSMLVNVASILNGGTKVNGVSAPPSAS